MRVGPKEIRELIELVSRSDFSKFEMEREGFKLKLVKQSVGSPGGGDRGIPATAASVLPGRRQPGRRGGRRRGRCPATREPVDDGLVELNSPIVGTFYRAPSPDAPPFVEVGARSRRGRCCASSRR